ncbi:hypothetical protein R6Q59_028268 [Mikania micrantha]|uniref:Uncharacterized protein n=1 Tax=Mikania micrantha TaxID=192012 RepID=A0A5N6M859_9ASTR|nr:hypothetical protein E3N88_32145 [Mikania micrantha]
MADVAGYHGGDGGDEPPHGHSYRVPNSCESSKPSKRRSSGKNLNLYDKFQKNGSRPLPIEFDFSSNLYRAVGENYQLFIRLISNEVDRHAPFHYRSWQEVPGDVKMSILTTLHNYFDLAQYHNTEYWDGIKLGIQADCVNRYKDRKTKLKKHFDKVGGYDNTERAKQNPPKGMGPEEWVQLIDGLFTTSTYKNRSMKNTANRSKQLYGSYHGTQSYAQRRYDEVKEGGTPQHVEGWRDMHYKGSSGWYNQLAEQHWGNINEELNKAKSTSGGDDTPVDEVEVLQRSLGERRGHVRGVGRKVKSITPDLPPQMYYPAANELQQQLAEANARWEEQQRINAMMQQQINKLMSMQGGQGSSSFYYPGFETNQEKDQEEEEEEDDDDDDDEDE